MSAKHTPGPWHAREWQCHGATSVGRMADAGFEHIAECSGLGRQVPSAQEEADARLIAAAPELLQALQMALVAWNTQFEGEQDNDEWCVAARAAIAKACGEQQ